MLLFVLIWMQAIRKLRMEKESAALYSERESCAYS